MQRKFIPLTLKHSTAAVALVACTLASSTFISYALAGDQHTSGERASHAQANAKRSADAIEALTDQLVAETLAKGTPISKRAAGAGEDETLGATPGDGEPQTYPRGQLPQDMPQTLTPSVPKTAASPYGPQISLRPVARNSFTIQLQKGALHSAPANDGGFMLRTAGYVIAHEVCGKFNMRVSSVAFRTQGKGEAASVTGTVVCKVQKDKVFNS